MPRLMDVAREIRLIIWEKCLIRPSVFPYLITDDECVIELQYGGRIDTTSTSFGRARHRYDTGPSVNILLVSKDIYNEALRFLYSQNTFVLPTPLLSAKFFGLLTPSTNSMITSIDIGFPMLDMTPMDYECARQVLADGDPLPAFTNVVNGQTIAETPYHRITHNYLVHFIWHRKLAPVLELPSLKNLTLDFTDTFCFHGECELPLRVLRLFQDGFKHGVPENLVLVDPARRLRVRGTTVLSWFHSWTDRRLTASASGARVSGTLGRRDGGGEEASRSNKRQSMMLTD